MSRPHSIRSATVWSAAVAAAVVFAWAATAPAARGEDETTLQGRIQNGKQREQSLSSAATQLGQLASATTRQVGLLRSRVDGAQGDLDRAEALAQETESRLHAAKARVKRLRHRLHTVRARLGAVLRARYAGDRPDLVTVMLNAHGFASLLDTVDFLRRVEHTDAQVLDQVRHARVAAQRQQRTLTLLAVTRRNEATAVLTRRDALSGIAAGLSAREATLSRAQAARLSALSATQASRQKAEQELTALLAARRQTSTSEAGPGGPWAIPWAIVQCESGGQNLPSNGSGPSGYYQILAGTWKSMGGSTAQAYQAPKSEQDAIASKIWAGGAGRGSWTCASMVA